VYAPLFCQLASQFWRRGQESKSLWCLVGSFVVVFTCVCVCVVAWRVAESRVNTECSGQVKTASVSRVGQARVGERRQSSEVVYLLPPTSIGDTFVLAITVFNTVVGSRRDSEQGIPVVVLLSVCSSSLSVLWTV